MRKYQTIRTSSDVVLIRTDRGVETEIARFQLVASEELIRNVADVLIAALEDGRNHACLVQEATNAGRGSGVVLTAEKTDPQTGFAEIFVGVFRDNESLAGIRVGINSSGDPRLMIKRRSAGGSKSEIEIDLSDIQESSRPVKRVEPVTIAEGCA